jgi:hypothetical protein
MSRWKVDDATLDDLVSASRRDDPFSLFSQGPDDAMAQMRDALSGRHHHIRQHLRDRLGNRRTFLDTVSARLMAAAGMDPLCICVIAGKVDMFTVAASDEEDETEAQVYIDRSQGSPDGFIWMAPAVGWRINRGLTMRALPETALASLEGRTIPEIISHPVTDAACPRVTGIIQEMFGGVTHVHVDVAPSCACLTPQELLELEIFQTEAA